jgi:hypothetical protein
VLLLTACASSKPETRIQIEYLPPPEPLLSCAAPPAVPDTIEQARVGEYLTDLWASGDDCRAKLNAVRQWVKDAGHAKN